MNLEEIEKKHVAQLNQYWDERAKEAGRMVRNFIELCNAFIQSQMEIPKKIIVSHENKFEEFEKEWQKKHDALRAIQIAELNEFHKKAKP